MRYMLLLISLFIVLLLEAQGVYKTEPLSSDIHTIQVNKNGDWSKYPLIDMNSGDYICLNFDRVSDNSSDRLRYKIIHCNADWTESSLSSIEFLDGFNDNLINDYAVSTNTTINYTNYNLNIPNNDFSLKVSGNYVIQVYEEDNTSNLLLNACFSVLDSRIAIGGNMTSNTLIDSNKEHQQVSFTINHPSLTIRDPFSELKVIVRQNDRQDNQKIDVKPSYIQSNRLVYEQNRALIFEAGNEYRRFEFPSYRYNGLRMMRTEYKRPYYFAWLIPDKIRAHTRYTYDEDQNGRFLIRNSEGRDSNTDADYFYINFTLEAENPFLENVYLNGNFTNNSFTDTYQMQYDYNQKAYIATLQLKQGAYNYQYLTDKGDSYTTSDIEGNYYETENEYQIFVYHRTPGQRYDSLVGYLLIGK